MLERDGSHRLSECKSEPLGAWRGGPISAKNWAIPIRVTVWSENVHEQNNELTRSLYPRGMHGCIAEVMNEDSEIVALTATLQEPEHGLTEEVLAKTDVLTWWDHRAHREVADEVADRVQRRVLQGMG